MRGGASCFLLLFFVFPVSRFPLLEKKTHLLQGLRDRRPRVAEVALAVLGEQHRERRLLEEAVGVVLLF